MIEFSHMEMTPFLARPVLTCRCLSQSTFESFDKNQDKRMEGKARSEATFRYVVENVTKMTESQLSPPCYIRNLPWRIKVMSKQPGEESPISLGFYLECNGESESTSWSCYARAQLRLLSGTKGESPVSRKIQHLFSSEEPDWGFNCFLLWKDVSKPGKGYLKNDTIALEVYINAEAPNGVNSKEEDEARSEATFQYEVKRVSEMKGPQLSLPCYIRNLPWRIMAFPTCIHTPGEQPTRSLNIFLQCYGESESTSWNCYATAELRLLSCNKGQGSFCGKIKYLFSSEENDWGFRNFMLWDDVLNPDKGYIENDTIALEVHVKANAPNGLNSKEQDEARSEATFHCVIKNVSKMTEYQLSFPCYIRNLSWRIKAFPTTSQIPGEQSRRSLGFYLQCNNESKSTSWNCYATAELRLLSRNAGQGPFSRKIQHLFSSEEDDWGVDHFMPWNDVLNPEKGYIETDTITLEAHVKCQRLTHGRRVA